MSAYKIKTFVDINGTDLEDKANAWFEDHKDVTIIDIKFSTCQNSIKCLTNSMLVVYKEKEEGDQNVHARRTDFNERG